MPAHASAEQTAPQSVQHQTAEHEYDATPMPTVAAPPPPIVPSAPIKTPSPIAASPPAEQLAPVLVSIANAPIGAQHMTLQLQPDALGQVQIQIGRPPDAPIHIRIEAERPETLALLQRDTPQLQRALDQAGLPRETVTLSFHATPAVTATPTAQDAGQPSMQFLGTGHPHQGFGEGRPQRGPLPFPDLGEDPGTPANGTSRATTVRPGIDITA